MNSLHHGKILMGMGCFLITLSGIGSIPARAEEVVATGHRVNLRARPELKAEVVGQVEYGQRLSVRSREGDWIRVAPPDYVDMWVHRDFVENGRVTVPTLNVRGGPGINYQVLAGLHRNDLVEVRGEFGDWLRIAPVSDAAVWIHADYVEAVRPPRPEPPPVRAEPRAVDPPRPQPEHIEPPPTPHRRPPERIAQPPPDLDLVPLEGQGDLVEFEGLVGRVGFLFGRPSPYRLVRQRGHILETVCFIKGNERQLESLLGQPVVVSGRQYWVQGVRHPVVVPEQIVRQAR